MRLATQRTFFYSGRCHRPQGWMANFAFGRRRDAVEHRHYRLYLYFNLFKSWPFASVGAVLDI